MRKYLALLLTLIPLSSSAMFSIRDMDLMEEKRFASIKPWEDLTINDMIDFTPLFKEIKAAEPLSFIDYSTAINIIQQTEKANPISGANIAILAFLFAFTFIFIWFFIKSKNKPFVLMTCSVFFSVITASFSLTLYDHYRLNLKKENAAVNIVLAQTQYENVSKIIDNYVQNKENLLIKTMSVRQCRSAAKTMEIGTLTYWEKCLPKTHKVNLEKFLIRIASD